MESYSGSFELSLSGIMGGSCMCVCVGGGGGGGGGGLEVYIQNSQ